jgi:hypothetical protein
MSLSTLDHIVQALKAIRSGVDSCFSIGKGLEVHSAIGGGRSHVTKTPDSKDPET